jgi:hypothetical protein
MNIALGQSLVDVVYYTVTGSNLTGGEIFDRHG